MVKHIESVMSNHFSDYKVFHVQNPPGEPVFYMSIRWINNGNTFDYPLDTDALLEWYNSGYFKENFERFFLGCKESAESFVKTV